MYFPTRYPPRCSIVEDTCVAVLTSISADHMGFLGKTLPEIAVQKAGIT